MKKKTTHFQNQKRYHDQEQNISKYKKIVVEKSYNRCQEPEKENFQDTINKVETDFARATVETVLHTNQDETKENENVKQLEKKKLKKKLF